MLAAALCGCMTAGIAIKASLANVQIDDIEIESEANINVLGLLGITDDLPLCNPLHYKVIVGGPNPEKLVRVKEEFDKQSALVANLQNQVNVTTEIAIKQQ